MGRRQVFPKRVLVDPQPSSDQPHRSPALIDGNHDNAMYLWQSHHRLIDGNDVRLCKAERDGSPKGICLWCIPEHRGNARITKRTGGTPDGPPSPDRQKRLDICLHPCPFSCRAFAIFTSLRMRLRLFRSSSSSPRLISGTISSCMRSATSSGFRHIQEKGSAITIPNPFRSSIQFSHTLLYQALRSRRRVLLLGFFPP